MTDRGFSNASSQPVEPMTGSLMGRLFVVPGVIVAVLICLAMVVVLFATPAVGQRPTIDELLGVMEAGGGGRTAGALLLPRDREVWQAAQELATRLARKEKELPASEWGVVGDRIARILRSTDGERSKPSDDSVVTKRRFLLLALARLATPEAADTIAEYLTDGDAMTRQFALRGLMEVGAAAGGRAAVTRIAPLLDDASPEVQMVACIALGSLADEDDASVISSLRGKLDADREVQWNAALALGRLGSATGKYVLMNMLDRDYWRRNRVRYVEDSKEIDREFSPQEIENYLVVSIEACRRLSDHEVRAAVERLRQDESPRVREAAQAALEAGRASARARSGEAET